MKAVRVTATPDGGKVDVLDIPVPAVGAGQVLVRVLAAGLNRGEIKQAGELRSATPLPLVSNLPARCLRSARA